VSDLDELSPRELLSLHAKIMEELRVRGILRSSNNPTADLAEVLFCRAFRWTRADTNSSPTIDAIGADGARYQIKGRRLTRHNASRQLGAIRDFAGRHFDYLAGVLFAEDHTVLRAALVPYSVVAERASFVKRTNSHRFVLHEDVWNALGVRDVTKELGAIIL
jgi:hypothetical protein